MNMSPESPPPAAAIIEDDAPPETPRRTGCWLKGCFTAFALVLLALVVAGVAAYLVYDHVRGPGVAGVAVPVTIPEGATGLQAGNVLADAGVIEHPAFMRLAIRLDQTHRPIKHGEYIIPRGLSPLEILHLLQEGPNRALRPEDLPPDRRVTVPEGLTIGQAAQLFDDPEAFITAAQDPDLIAQLDIDAPTLEGFLMPNTYYFDAKPTEHEVVERMVEQFQTELEKMIPADATVDLLKLITVASLVEEEARVEEERSTVAAVIYNRLAKNMTLDMDSTLQFALNKYGQRLLDTDKEIDSPYNTYRHAGLPPGPISSPGVASIRAAIFPADVDYLFFVSNADGKTHTFSTTLAEHNRAVARFREEIAEQRRQQQVE